MRVPIFLEHPVLLTVEFLGSVFMRFSSNESIVVEYHYYRIHQGNDTIELVSIFLSSLLANARYVVFKK